MRDDLDTWPGRACSQVDSRSRQIRTDLPAGMGNASVFPIEAAEAIEVST